MKIYHLKEMITIHAIETNRLDFNDILFYGFFLYIFWISFLMKIIY